MYRSYFLFMKNHSVAVRGFTLIEVLIVVAIVGILSSVVLSALGGGRTKSVDGKVRSQLIQIKNATEIYYNNRTPISYGPAATMSAAASTCTVNGASAMWTDTTSGLNGLVGMTSTWPAGTTLWCNTSASAFAVAAQSPTGAYFCIDSATFSVKFKNNAGTVYNGFIPAASNPTLSGATAVICN